MRQVLFAALFGLLIADLLTGAEPTPEPLAKSTITSVGVFKNGLALVQQEIDVPGPGAYRLDIAPNPVHGSFWIKSNCDVESALKLLDFDTPRPVAGLQDELAGKNVVIHLKDKADGIAGTVEPTSRSQSSFVTVKTATGSTYINPAEITSIDVKGAGKTKEGTIKQQRPVLVLTVDKTDKKPAIVLSYLTHGFSWAPSYLVEIGDGNNLTIEMAAAVRNEFADLKESEIKLMTGTPAIEFSNVISPLSPKQNLEKFLSALQSDGLPGVDGNEMQFTSIGKRNLKSGESLSLRVGRAKVGYERLVEWNVASDENGSITEETWDVLQFKNPFAFPMGTAPAMVMDRDQFKSQRTCSRALVGEASSLRFARSQDMRTRGKESEELVKKPAEKDAKVDKEAKIEKGEIIRIGMNEYRRATIDGELTVTNQRKQPSKVILRRDIKGKVLQTDVDAKVQAYEEGLRAVNPSNEIVWTVSLGAGEEKTVRYRYTALILLSRERWAATW